MLKAKTRGDISDWRTGLLGGTELCLVPCRAGGVGWAAHNVGGQLGVLARGRRDRTQKGLIKLQGRRGAGSSGRSGGLIHPHARSCLCHRLLGQLGAQSSAA